MENLIFKKCRFEQLSGRPPVSRAGGQAFEPRVVCYEALVVGALNVTTILVLFDKKCCILFNSNYYTILYTKNLPIRKLFFTVDRLEQSSG